MTAGADAPSFNLDCTPPTGCTIEALGPLITLHASTRSLSKAASIGVMCLFWNGVTSIFACQALAGLYINLVGPPPGGSPSSPAPPAPAASP